MARVFVDAQKTPRPPSVQPAKPHKVEPIFLANASLIDRPPTRIKNVDLNPAVIRPKTNGPENRCDALFFAVDYSGFLFWPPDFFKRGLVWRIDVVVFDQYDDLKPSLDTLEREPDLIISDYRLQGTIQGTDLVVEINDALETACPAIVVPADTNPDLIRNIRHQGFPVLIKPVSPPSLRVTMHNILYEPELVPEISGMPDDG